MSNTGTSILICVSLIQIGLGFLARNHIIALENAAISRGYALHCPTDGDFAWKDECK